MRAKGYFGAVVLALAVLFAYGTVNAQVPEKVKDAAGKTKDVTVDAAKKTAHVTTDAAKKTADVTTDAAKKTADVTGDTAKKTKVVVTDGLAKAADKTGDAASATGKAVGSTTKSFGNHAVTVTENVAATTVKKGKYYSVTAWDGTKWVTKKTFYPDKNQ